MSPISGRWLGLFVLATVVVVVSLMGMLTWRMSADITVVKRAAPYVASFGQAVRLEIADRVELTIRNRAGDITNVGRLALNVSSTAEVNECQATAGDLCYEWPGNRELRISRHLGTPVSDVDCYDVTWQARACVTQVLQDCYSLREAHWFGGFEDFNQYWPLNRVQQQMAPYVAGDTWSRQYGDVLERLFVSSNGFGIYVYPDVPLYLSFNQSDDGQICLVAKYDNFPYFNPSGSLPSLRYQLCQGPDVKTLHSHMISQHVARPRDIPDEEVFRGSIWSTWAMYKGAINQSQVMDFARNIVASGIPYSQLEIDDDWTPKYGGLDFNREKFPDPKGMVAQLTQLGFRVTVWIHPFINMDSQAAVYAGEKGYLVRAVSSTLPALVSWWRAQMAFLLDVTNDEALQWFLNNTRFLKDTYNISSFKFDAGETNWLPKAYSTHVPLDSPDEFSRRYVQMAYSADPDLRAQEVRVGTRSQHQPIMFRMLDRQSAWGYHRAIRTVIPCALTFGLIGYPFVLPDMIGGNGVDEVHIDSTVYPEAELYVRWLQVNTFLPFVQFSVAPWVYNSTIQSICTKFMDIRARYSHTIISLAREATRTGAPIVRPLWWIAPADPAALTSDSQYLLGDDLLVAPVLEEGSRSRDVYLPAGTWREETRGTGGGSTFVGPRWLRGYRADLDELPFFQRVSQG